MNFFKMNTISNEVKPQILKIIKEEKVDLVECKVISARGNLGIRLLVDYPQGGISLNKCMAINKKLSQYLEDFFDGIDCTVEVNSPGLERALRTEKDFLRAKGKVVLLWLKEPFEGKDFIEAQVKDVFENRIHFNYKGKDLVLNVNKIKTGKQKFR